MPPAPALVKDELAQQLASGDLAALEQVIRTLGPRIMAGLVRRHPILSNEDIEDVLSVASQRLWNSRLQYDAARGSLISWYFIIADNAAKDLLKKEARRLEQAADLAHVPAPESLAVDDDVNGQAMPAGLEEILLDLGPVDHQILWAYAEAGGVGPWAADLSLELGMRPGTIRVRCRRIKERIRKAMQPHPLSCQRCQHT